ncbi:biotin transporter BioY [Luteitalea sp. TBR-22]|uniref:biotin transporter BioY n=1 Tax=Luteitalea sp. TBR-22 TaxID=2802971 RepID=UPI001EF3F4DD|nr:biotin transporter BioY [Luteitalea sp. TBR-22]
MYAASRMPLGFLAGTTLFDVLSDRSSSRLLRGAVVVAATAATAMAAQFSIPFDPIPFTLQPMVVLLAAAALGSRLGAYAQVLYLIAGVAGLPVFAASPTLPAGFARLLGPTGGFLLAYPAAAWLTGMLAERRFDRRYFTSFLAMLAGLVVVYAGGVAGLSATLGVDAATSAATPFAIADLLKLVLAAGVLPSVWQLVARTR